MKGLLKRLAAALAISFVLIVATAGMASATAYHFVCRACGKEIFRVEVPDGNDHIHHIVFIGET